MKTTETTAHLYVAGDGCGFGGPHEEQIWRRLNSFLGSSGPKVARDELKQAKATADMENHLRQREDQRTPEEEEAFIDKGNELQDELGRTGSVRRAFQGKDGAIRLADAADYADRWFSTEETIFSVYYLCMAGAALWPCCTAISSNV